MPDDDWMLGSDTVAFRDEERRWNLGRWPGKLSSPTQRCPECGNEDLSYDGTSYAADRDERPDAPLVCEDCGWHGDAVEARP